jgi:hypothetical protein
MLLLGFAAMIMPFLSLNNPGGLVLTLWGLPPDAGQRGRHAIVTAGKTVGPVTDVPKAFKKLQNGSDMRGVALEGNRPPSLSTQ